MLRLRTGSICMVASSHDAATRLPPAEAAALVDKVIIAALDALVLIESSGERGNLG